MTVAQIAEVAGMTGQNVRKIAKEIGVGTFIPGKATMFNEDESIKLMNVLRKRGFIQPQQFIEEPQQNIAQLGAMVANLCMAVNEQMKMMTAQQNQISAIISQPKQIDFIQDYFTIKGYSNKIGQQLTFSEALSIGRAAGKLSREKGIEIRKAEDERFGNVNSYHIDILKEVFTI